MFLKSHFFRFLFAPLVFKIASWNFYTSCSILFSKKYSNVSQLVPLLSQKCPGHFFSVTLGTRLCSKIMIKMYNVTPLSVMCKIWQPCKGRVPGSFSSTCRFMAGMVGLPPKWVRLAPTETNTGLFQIRFQYIFAQRQNVLKSDLKKSRICPIWGQSDPFWVQIWSARHSHCLLQQIHTDYHSLGLTDSLLNKGIK